MSFCPHSAFTEGHLENRAKIERRLELLPANAGGKSRDGCVYCAYERGWRDALAAVGRRLGSVEPGSGD